MPYCPECGAEYREGIEVCADCGVRLTDDPPENNADRRRFVEFYACYDSLEASRIHDLLLTRGIDSLVRDMSISAFPTAIGENAEKRIAVPEDRVEDATTMLKTAIVDGEVSPDGKFLEKGKGSVSRG